MVDLIYEPMFPMHSSGAEGLKKFELDATHETPDSIGPRVNQLLDAQGAVILNGVELTKKSDLLEWADPVGKLMDYTGGTNHRQADQGVLNVGTEPSFANVSAHNEMSYSYRYPNIFMIGCISPTSSGGETVVGDNEAITDDIFETHLGHKLWDQGVIYTRNFSDRNHLASGPLGVFTTWQDVFGTNDRHEAESIAHQTLGGRSPCTIAWSASGNMRLSYEAPAFEFDPDTGKNLLFFSIGNSGYWFRQWAPYNTMPNEDRPFHATFGDGSPFTEEDFKTMVAISNRHSFPVKWERGKVAILRNRRFTHARPPFVIPDGESRELGVLLLEATSRRGIVIGQPDAASVNLY